MDLVARVRRGDLNFERFVELMQEPGYISENDQENSCGFGSSAMEAVKQEDFNKLFEFFFPERICNISVQCVATDDGGERGAFAYALFNANVVTRERMLKFLRLENKKTSAWIAASEGGEQLFD
jgi:hypothetical protein